MMTYHMPAQEDRPIEFDGLDGFLCIGGAD